MCEYDLHTLNVSTIKAKIAHVTTCVLSLRLFFKVTFFLVDNH